MFRLTLFVTSIAFGFASEIFESTTESQIETVTALDLSNKGITSLHDYDFSRYTALEELNLSHNEIDHIKEDTFIKNKKLKKLNLSGNKKLELPQFSTLLIADIEELNLADCDIKELPTSIFDGLIYLKTIDLSGNPLFVNSIPIAALLALASPEKVVLPEVDGPMIEEICHELDLTIDIKRSEDNVETIRCMDVRDGTWHHDDLIHDEDHSGTDLDEGSGHIYVPIEIKKEYKHQLHEDELIANQQTSTDLSSLIPDALDVKIEEAETETETALQNTEVPQSPKDEDATIKVDVHLDGIPVPIPTHDESQLPETSVNKEPTPDVQVPVDSHSNDQTANHPNHQTDNQPNVEPDTVILDHQAMHPQPPSNVHRVVASSPASVQQVQSSDSTKSVAVTEQSNTGTTILICLVVGVVVAGIAAFGYKFYKSRTYQAAPAQPVERELKEIVVENKANGPNNVRDVNEKEPLMQNRGNSVEIKEIDETTTEQKSNNVNAESNANNLRMSGPYMPTTTSIKPSNLNINGDQSQK